MRTIACEFYSYGIRLDGLLQLPDRASLRPRAAIILSSGFQGLKELIPAKLWRPLTDAGYACFTFDYRGLGTSAGERGRIIPMEQVEDIRNAITYLESQAEIDANHIGLIGWGFGGGLGVQAAADDQRVRAVACLNGVGDGGRAVRATRTHADWLAMQARLEADRTRRAMTGQSALISPWEVVPLDPTTRQSVDEDMYGNHDRFAAHDVSLQSAEAYYAFRPELAVHRISPRPLLIVHGVRNALHPIGEACSLYAHAREPKTLIELPDASHLDWIQPSDPRYATTVPRIVAWFREHLPT